MEMNSSNGSTSNSPAGLPLGSGQKPGERLRQVRLSQKRELADIAKELNIPERHLLALEADDYKLLPEPAFVRGYLRSYARLLGVDGNALVARFAEVYTHDTGLSAQQNLENSPLKPLARLQSRDQRDYRGWARRLLIALLIFGVLYGVYWLITTWPQSAPVAEQPAQVLAPPPAAANLPNTVTALPIQDLSPIGQDRLVIQLSRDAELTIKDSMGKTLISGQQTAAQPVQVDGSSPFGISLPDAEAVSSLSLNNETVDVKPYIVNGRAEFRLSR
jgi:cytoskeletal protein RodZ